MSHPSMAESLLARWTRRLLLSDDDRLAIVFATALVLPSQLADGRYWMRRNDPFGSMLAELFLGADVLRRRRRDFCLSVSVFGPSILETTPNEFPFGRISEMLIGLLVISPIDFD